MYNKHTGGQNWSVPIIYLLNLEQAHSVSFGILARPRGSSIATGEALPPRRLCWQQPFWKNQTTTQFQPWLPALMQYRSFSDIYSFGGLLSSQHHPDPGPAEFGLWSKKTGHALPSLAEAPLLPVPSALLTTTPQTQHSFGTANSSARHSFQQLAPILGSWLHWVNSWVWRTEDHISTASTLTKRPFRTSERTRKECCPVLPWTSRVHSMPHTDTCKEKSI